MALGNRFKKLRIKKQSKGKDGQDPLLDNMVAQHIEATDGPGEQILDAKRTDQSGVYPDPISTESEMSKEVLMNLRKILRTESNAQDVENAAAMMNKWGQRKDVTVQKKGVYSQDWLCDVLQLIDESVERNFHILSEDKPETSDVLQRIEIMMCSEVCRLTPVLKDAGLLGYLIQSYSHQLFIRLNLLLNQSITVKEVFQLLYWTKRVFFSSHSQDVLGVLDPLLFSGWFEKAKKKLLTVLKKEMAETLNNILCFETTHDHDKMSTKEEWFVQMYIDVTQFLHGVIKQAKAFSLSLMHQVQMLCIQELHHFVKNYVHEERKCLENLQLRKANFIYMCRIISNCKKFRCLTVQLSNPDKYKSDDDLNTVCLLKKLEDQVLSIVQKMMKHKAEENLESYFKRDDKHIYNLMDEIQTQCESLPQTEATKEIKTIIVNVAYGCVSHVYLDCLIKSKFKNLEKRWENVENTITQDVLEFHNFFTARNGSDEHDDLLQRMTEVLFCADVEALKLICATLFCKFPEDSEYYLPKLLRWNRTLSKRQVREVLDVSRLECLDDTYVKRGYPLRGLCCCLGC